jgi:hypothetical protein
MPFGGEAGVARAILDSFVLVIMSFDFMFI